MRLRVRAVFLKTGLYRNQMLLLLAVLLMPPAPLIAHILQAPILSQRFSPVVVSTMQKKGIQGVTSRYVIALEQNS